MPSKMDEQSMFKLSNMGLVNAPAILKLGTKKISKTKLSC
jgi:hypothetical protein